MPQTRLRQPQLQVWQLLCSSPWSCPLPLASTHTSAVAYDGEGEVKFMSTKPATTASLTALTVPLVIMIQPWSLVLWPLPTPALLLSCWDCANRYSSCQYSKWGRTLASWVPDQEVRQLVFNMVIPKVWGGISYISTWHGVHDFKRQLECIASCLQGWEVWTLGIKY